MVAWQCPDSFSSDFDVKCDRVISSLKVSPFRTNVGEAILENVGDICGPPLSHVVLDNE
jgi:hypothetical protein